MIILRPHQQEAYDSWISSGCIGTVKSVTGSGKTHVALKAIEVNPEGIWIIVPTVPLQDQWYEHIKSLGLGDKVGLLGNGSQEMTKSITIAIINSARDKQIKCRLLIIDEVHRVLSAENFEPIKNADFTSILALSATPEKDECTYWDRFVSKVPIIYELPLEEATERGIVAEFQDVLVPCELTPEEAVIYAGLTEQIKKILSMYGHDFRIAMMAIKRGAGGPAIMLTKYISERKQLVHMSKGKIQKAIDLINEMPEKKIIVFSEFIDTLTVIDKSVNQLRPRYIYHSGIKKKERKQLLENFRNSTNGVILSARAIDEGVDIPDCDTAVLVSGSSTKRQYIQRLGRIIRPKENKLANLYQLYCKGTMDERATKKRRRK